MTEERDNPNLNAARDVEKEKEPGQPLTFGNFNLPPLGPDAPAGLEPLVREYLTRAAANEDVGRQMIDWARQQAPPAPAPPIRVNNPDGGRYAALQTASQHIQGRDYVSSPPRSAAAALWQPPVRAAPGTRHPPPADRALNPYYQAFGNTWRNTHQPSPAATMFGGIGPSRGTFDPFNRAPSHMSVDPPTPQPNATEQRFAFMEARIEELTKALNNINIQPPPPPPPPQGQRDDSTLPMQTDTAQDIEAQRKEKERFDRAIHQAYKATPAFCPEEEDYTDWIEMTWVKWATCGLDMDRYEHDRSKDTDLKRLLYNCLTIKPPGEKSSQNHTFLIGMNPTRDLPNDSFPAYYDRLMTQFSSPDRQIQAAAEFDVRKQGREEEPAVYAAEKLKLWYRANPGPEANNVRAFLHSAINGLLNREVRRRLFELGQSIQLPAWVTTVQNVSMIVWTLFKENVGPDGISGSGLSVGKKNVLALRRATVSTVDEEQPENADAPDMDDTIGLTGIEEAVIGDEGVYAVNQNNRGRCFDCGSFSHYQNSPHCNEKGARKYATTANPASNSKMKKITYQPTGDNKTTNQVALKKKSGFPSMKTRGRSSSVRPKFLNKKKVRYVQVIEEASSEEENSENETEGENEEISATVANIVESPVCYGWSDTDATLLGQSIFGVTTPSPSPSKQKIESHTTNLQIDANKNGLNANSVPGENDEANEAKISANSPTQHIAEETVSGSDTSEKPKKMPEKEKRSAEKQAEIVCGASAGQTEQESRPSTPYPAPPPGGNDDFVRPAEKRRRPIPVNLPPIPPTWGPEGIDSPANPLTVATSDSPPAVDPAEDERDAKSLKKRAEAVARARLYHASFQERSAWFQKGVPPPPPGIPLPTPALEPGNRRTKQGPITRAETAGRNQPMPGVMHETFPKGRGRGQGVKTAGLKNPCPHCLPCHACAACKLDPPPKSSADRPMSLCEMPPVEAVVLRTKHQLRCAFFKLTQSGNRPWDNGVDLDRAITAYLSARIRQLEKENNKASASPTVPNNPPAEGPPTAEVESELEEGEVREDEASFEILSPPELDELFEALTAVDQANIIGDPSRLFNLTTRLLEDTLVTSQYNNVSREVLVAAYQRLKSHWLWHIAEKQAQHHKAATRAKAERRQLEKDLSTARAHVVQQTITLEENQLQQKADLKRIRTLEKDNELVRKQLAEHIRLNNPGHTLRLKQEIDNLSAELKRHHELRTRLATKETTARRDYTLLKRQSQLAESLKDVAETKLSLTSNRLKAAQAERDSLKSQFRAAEAELSRLREKIKYDRALRGGEAIQDDSEVQILPTPSRPAPPLITLDDQTDVSSQTNSIDYEDLLLHELEIHSEISDLQEKYSRFCRAHPVGEEREGDDRHLIRLSRTAAFVQSVAEEFGPAEQRDVIPLHFPECGWALIKNEPGDDDMKVEEEYVEIPSRRYNASTADGEKQFSDILEEGMETESSAASQAELEVAIAAITDEEGAEQMALSEPAGPAGGAPSSGSVDTAARSWSSTGGVPPFQ